MAAEVSINQLLADKLKALRHESNYSQEFVAAKLKITQQFYSQLENNKRIISFVYLQGLAQLYNKQTTDFYPPIAYIKNKEVTLPPPRTEDQSLATWMEFYEAKLLVMEGIIAEYAMRLAKKDEQINALENLLASFRTLLENQRNYDHLHKEQQEKEE